MDIKDFLAEFEYVVSMSKGVQQLREMILQLAIQGKLVEQNSNDEPALDFLEKIKSKKAMLLKDKKIGKQITFTKIVEYEKPFQEPKGWSFARLGMITNKIGSGSTPKGGKRVYVKEGVPFLRSQNIWNTGLKLDNVAYIPQEIHKKMFRTTVFPKDILLNITGASLGRCALVPENLSEANVSQHVTIIRPTNPEIAEYLHLCMLSPYTQKMIWTRQVGMAREGLSKKVLENFEIPIPPFEEQKRIVAKVHKLTVLCDKLEKLQQQRNKLTGFIRNASLNALINTKNHYEFKMAWNRAQKNFDILFKGSQDLEELKGILRELSTCGIFSRKNKFSNYKLKDVISFGPKNGLSPKGVEFETPVKVLTLSATTSGKIDLNKFKYVDVEVPVSSTLWLKPNDILLQRGNSKEYVGVSAIFEGPEDEYIYPDLMMKFVCNCEIVTPEYLHLCLLSPSVRTYMWNHLTGTSSTMPKVNKRIVENIPLLIPSIEEQKRIVSKVEFLITICDTLGLQLTNANITAENFVKSAISTISGTRIHKEEKMKIPKAKLITKLRLVKTPLAKEHAPLCTVLTRYKNELSAKALWNYSGLEIDTFYHQLKYEMKNGWIEEPQKAEMQIVREVEVTEPTSST